MDQGIRTERDIAAEVVARLLDARILARSPLVIHTAARVVGVSIDEIRKATETKSWLRAGATQALPVKRDEGTLPVFEKPPAPVVESEVIDTGPAKRLQAWNEKQRRRKEPKPGKRVCSRCAKLLPKSEFAVKNHRTGQLRSMCHECLSKYQAQRYLSVEKMAILGPALRLIIQDGDEALIGIGCSTCGQSVQVGDEVVSTDAQYHHAHHFDH